MESPRQHVLGLLPFTCSAPLYDREVAATSPVRKPNRKEIDLFYKTHRSQFQAPERVHVLHIVKNVLETDSRDVAREVLGRAASELGQGTPFGVVADRYSDCAGNGGDLGWIVRGEMVEEFEDVVFDLAPGETAPIFESRFGLHIAHLVGKRAAGIRPLSEVYEEIADAMYQFRLKQIQEK